MMIHSARQTGKFIRFVRGIRKLVPNCPVDHETVAVGLLERLWHFTIASAKRGDIGREPDDVIAEACGWFGDAADFIELLIECGWLDRHEEHRLVVHDWDDHAPSHIKRNAHRWGGLIEQQCPAASPNRSGEAFDDVHEPCSGNKTAQVSGLDPTPNLTKPNLTKPNGRGAELPAASPYRSDEFQELWRLWITHHTACNHGVPLPTQTDAQLMQLFALGDEQAAIERLKLSLGKSKKGNILDPDEFRKYPKGSEADEVDKREKEQAKRRRERNEAKRRRIHEANQRRTANP